MKRIDFGGWAFALILALVAGCNERVVPPPSGVTGIPFDLTLPSNTIQADYYGISGVNGVRQASIIKDSVLVVTIFRYYAQFRAADNSTIPFSLTLNDIAMKQHLESDTLRLGSGFGSLAGDHVWTLSAEGEDDVKFIIKPVDLVDTVQPFGSSLDNIVHSDAGLTITWRRPLSGTGGMFISWQAPEANHNIVVADFEGKYTIPQVVMQNLRGNGKVSFTRFRNDIKDYKGKKVNFTRASQVTYDVVVQ